MAVADPDMKRKDEHLSDNDYRTAASRKYARIGEIEIDEDAKVSRGKDLGAYVQARVWVYDIDCEC